jgi:SAM-dependent methyltransferase
MSHRHEDRRDGRPAPPSRWVERWAELIAPGARVLDFAAGSGRNGVPLAAAGVVVVAADRDAGALDRAGAGVLRLLVDLEGAPWPFAERSFDAVVVCNFLHRPRIDAIFDLVRPGGLVVYETFAQGNERHGRPANPDFLLRPGELLEVAVRNGCVVLGYEHGLARGPGGPAVVQRICAARTPFDAAAAVVGER